MQTLFVVSSAKVNRHVGEDYDEILEVENQPTTETIQDWANRIKDSIRSLWHAQVDGDDRKVVVTLDAVTPYNAILLNLQIIMKAEEGIVIELPYWIPPEVKDAEARELLVKMDGKV